MNQPEPHNQSPEQKALSTRVKWWRLERGLSQEELANKAGFARSTLSKIENGLLSPTFEILLKLSRGFDVDITELLADDHKSQLAGRVCVDHQLPGTAIEYPNNRLFPLAAQFKDKKIQCFIVEFTCSDINEFGPWNSHNTEDMLYVLSGAMEFHSEGYEPIVLEEGQNIYFDGRMNHACISRSAEPCRCYYVFVPNT